MLLIPENSFKLRSISDSTPKILASPTFPLSLFTLPSRYALWTKPILSWYDRLKKLRELYDQRLKFYKDVSNFEINVDKYKSKDILVKIIEELNENN